MKQSSEMNETPTTEANALTPLEETSIIFEDYRSHDIRRWEPAFDKVVKIITDARTLERELTAANQRIAELEKDKEILDWLNNNYLSTEFWIKLGGEPDVRTAIDQAMSATKGQQ